MPETVEIEPAEKRMNTAAFIAGAVVVVILFAVALYLIFDLRGRVQLSGSQCGAAERGDKSH